MPDTKVSALTDGVTADSTDRIPVARDAGGGTFNNRYVTPAYIKTFTSTGAQTFSVGSVNGTGLDISQTWTGTGTYTGLKYNVGTDSGPANAASLLLDLQVGGQSQVYVQKNGNAVVTSISLWPNQNPGSAGGTPKSLWAGPNNTTVIGRSGVGIAYATGNGFGFANSTALLWGTSDAGENGNLFLTRANTATLQLGAADAAAPVAQTLQVQSVVGSTPGATDVAGANWTIKGSAGRGSGAGGSIIFQVAPAGSAGTGAQNAYATALTIASNKTVAFDAGSATAPSINFGTAGAGIYGVASNQIGVAIGAALVTSFTSSQVWNRVDNGEFIIGAFADVRLVRDAANTLALRNGTSAQRFNVYNTYTSSTNYETFKIDWITTANTCLIGTEKGSSGTARALALQTDGTTRLTIATGGDVSVANSLICNNVTNSSSTAYSDSIIFYPAGFASYFSKIKARINGSGTASTAGLVFAINAATSSANDAFWMLGNQVFAFGGDTSSFPGLKRSGSTTTLQVRLADDSAFGSFQTGGFSGGAPTIKTANYTQLEADYSLIFNGTGSITLTLLAAATYPGKILYVKTIAAQTVVSASSNVKPIDTDTAGTAILAATAGKWAMLQSDGTNWVIMAQG